MSAEADIAFVHRLYDNWNAGDMEAFYGMLDPQIVDHNAAEGESGRGGVREVLDHIRQAFPDFHYTVDDVIADGNGKVAVRLTARGTHLGELFGSPATGKVAEWKEIRVAVIRDGTVCTDHWAVIDAMGMNLQLGLIEPPGRVSW